MNKIAIIEDDIDICNMIAKFLENNKSIMNLEKSNQPFKQKILLYGYTEITLSVNELLKI